MPRKKTDHVQEQRLSLSNYERDLAQKHIKAQNLRSIAVGVSGTGLLLAGAGALAAGWAFMKFKAPDVMDDLKTFTFGALDSVADIILPGTPIEFRRRAQALAAERARIAAASSVYCTYSSERYNAAECSNVYAEKDAYFLALEAFRADVIAAGYFPSGTWWTFIFGGLGDIDPNKDTNPGNDIEKPEGLLAEIEAQLENSKATDEEKADAEAELRKYLPWLFD